MKRNLILTIAHRIEVCGLSPFFRPLRQPGYQGDVVIFCSGMKNESIREIESWGGTVVPFQFPGNHVRNRAAVAWPLWKLLFASVLPARIKEQLAHAVFHLFYRRHLLYLDFL